MAKGNRQRYVWRAVQYFTGVKLDLVQLQHRDTGERVDVEIAKGSTLAQFRKANPAYAGKRKHAAEMAERATVANV